MTVAPYPIRFEPFFRDYIWGGRGLADRLRKPIPESGSWAESWEVVDHSEHNSRVLNGALAGKTLGELVRTMSDWLCGSQSFAEGFPLLLKYLDCRRVLSVQVHPDDNYASQMNPPDLGKTEAWYIVDAEPDAVIYAGLKPGVDRVSLAAAIDAGRTEDCLHVLHPKPGDCVFIPAGTVHALGAGLLVAEIQQASNTTFRLFDWNRVDASGKSRPLHIDESLAVIDYQSGPRAFQVPAETTHPYRSRLVDCDKFQFDRLENADLAQVGGDGRCRILTVPNGSVTILFRDEMTRIGLGESVLLPASLGEVSVEFDPGSVLLEMSVPV